MYIILLISSLIANPFKPLDKFFLEVQDNPTKDSLIIIKNSNFNQI